MEMILGPFARGEAAYDEGALAYQFFLDRLIAQGVMIDVGAHVGGALRPFRRDGWTVHAFEPDPANRHHLLAEVEACTNVVVNAKAIAEKDGELIDFYSSPESTGVSSLSPFLDSHARSAQVETARLDTYLEANGVHDVDYLKVDTEGHDLFVFRTFPWQDIRPRVVTCEFEDNKTKRLGYSADDLAEFLIAQGYFVLVSQWHPIVRYGIAHDFFGLLHYKPDAIPTESWGNFLAVRSRSDLNEMAITARRHGATLRAPSQAG